jgi:hypothetical protein
VPPALDQLLAQCLSKTPEHRPASALELARSLQRIESQAGYSRTPIAVEGDRPDPTSAPRPAEGDQTRLKPVSVVSGSAPRDVSDPEPGPAAPPPPRHPVSSVVWWVCAAVVLVVIAGVLVWRAGSGSSPVSGPTDATGPTSQDSVVPGAVPEPIVTGRRIGDRVRFSWHAADRPEPGDSYQWRLPRTGGSHLTTATSVTVTSPARVCLQVRLARPDLPPSTYAGSCVT